MNGSGLPDIADIRCLVENVRTAAGRVGPLKG